MKAALKFLKENKVKIVFNKKSQSAFASVKTSTIYVGTYKLNKREILSMIFHEYAHVWSYRNKKYMKFYTLTKKDPGYKDYMRRMAYKTERYTDKMGAVFMKQVYPRYKFIAYYDQPIMKHMLMYYYELYEEE